MSLADQLGRAIAAVRVNHVVAGEGHWIKRRRRWMGPVIALGNVFLWLSRSRIRMFVSASAWQEWEVAAMRTLHGEPAAASRGPRVIVTRALPGISLREHLARGTLTTAMVAATARELARAHALSPGGRAFSHGDLHTGNVLYDAATDRAHLIDIETRHEARLGPRDRHADDLLVMLLDLLGRASADDVPALATAWLVGYHRRDVIEALELRLIVPRGLERVLWATRTRFASRAALTVGLETLRQVIAGCAPSSAVTPGSRTRRAQ